MANGRVALVTGGSRGSGRGIAIELAREGFDVAVNYHKDEGAANETVEVIRSLGRHARAYCASVEQWEEDVAMVDAVLHDFGRVDALICNAGIASRGRSVAETQPDEPKHVFAVHALSAHHLCSLLVPQMRERERGDVVVISSISTRIHGAYGAPYTMAKAALESLALTLAKEEQRNGIRVNIVAPGLMATEMGDRLAKARAGARHATDLDASAGFGRVCRPEDVGAAVAFLVSDRASLVSGQRIEVDGGWMVEGQG